MLILVRHGESEYQVDNKMTGQHDPGLTGLGMEQAEEVADTLAQYELDLVYSSELNRAVTTADLIMDRQKHFLTLSQSAYTKSDCLNERSGGSFEGITYPELREWLAPRKYKLWQRDYFEAPLDGESMKDVADRVIPFMKRAIFPYSNKGKNVLVVSHATVMKVIIGYLKGMEETEIPKIEVDNAVPFFYRHQAA